MPLRQRKEIQKLLRKELRVRYMGLFSKKKTAYPEIPEGCEPVLRCSICTGEQTLCARDIETGKLHELMLIRTTGELDSFCAQKGLSPEDIKRVY